MKKTVLNSISVCRAKIERREKQLAELERVKGIIKPETYKRVKADICRDIGANTKKLQETRAIIEDHPHKLQREILYYKWVQGMTFSQIAETLAYSENHIAREHGRAMKTINERKLKK